MAENCPHWRHGKCAAFDKAPTSACSWPDSNYESCALYGMAVVEAAGGSIEDQLQAVGAVPPGASVAGGRGRQLSDREIELALSRKTETVPQSKIELPDLSLYYAAFWQRAVALVIDLLLLLAPPLLLTLPFAGPDGHIAQPAGTFLGCFYFVWVFFIGPLAVFVFPLSKFGGQTLGKRLLGIMVVGQSGNKPSLGQSVARTLAYFVSYFPLGLGFLWCIWDEQKRCFHDLIANTRVVKKGIVSQAITGTWPEGTASQPEIQPSIEKIISPTSTALSAQDRARAGDKFQPQGMNAEDRETLERQYRRQLTERWTEAEKSEVQDLIQASFERIEKDEQEQPGVFLVEQMRKAVNPFIRAKAVRLLAEKYPANLMNIAADGLFDKDSRVRETAAQSLAASPHLRTFLGYPSFQDFLLIASSDECEGVRYWAKRCLDQVKYWADK